MLSRLKPFDENGMFRQHTDTAAIKHRAVRGAGVTLFSGGVGLAIQVASTVVLSRLLKPHEFGLVAMVTTFTLLLSNFGFNGFTEVIIQREKLDHHLTSTLFWINLCAGTFLTLGFAASGSLLAWFYKTPEVNHIAIGMSLTILFTSLSVFPLALLKRAMRFSAASGLDLLGRGVSILLSIFLGWIGWGHWALVAGAVVLPLTSAAGAWMICAWIPGLPRRSPEVGPAVRYALHTYGRFVTNYTGRYTDNLLLGWRFGSDLLGFYKKAFDLFLLPSAQVAPVTSVAVSAMSRFKPESEEYKRSLYGVLSVVALIGMGLSGYLTAIGVDLIRVLLGPGWGPTAKIFLFFAPGIGTMVLYNMHGWIHLSIGTADRWFRWGLVEIVVTVLLELAALPWGAEGMAIAWTVCTTTLIVPSMWYAGVPIQLKIWPIVDSMLRTLFSALVAGGLAWKIVQLIPSLAPAADLGGAIVRIAATSVLFPILYFGLIIAVYRGFEPLRRLSWLVQTMVTKRAAAAQAS